MGHSDSPGPPPPAEREGNPRYWIEDGTLFIRLPDGDVRRIVLGKSPAIQAVLVAVLNAAPTQAKVLILGGSGAGKGFLAEIIHLLSDRYDKPFIKADCGSLQESLIDSELFGHEKGAFTGAVQSKPGRFERAQGGTIFLDEVGNFTPIIQTKLLRVLQEKEFERVGGTTTLRADARVIAATNLDIEELCRKGTFRRDLYHRLNVITLRLPPLRDRREDIPVLVSEFISEYSRLNKTVSPNLSPSAMAALTEHDWPGNVRELQNCIERMVIMARGATITAEQIPALLRSEVTSPVHSIAKLSPVSEKERLKDAILAHNGNKSATARALGIHRTTLHRRIKRLGISL